ncbi:MAG TPA: hypothetical protein VF595_03785 [Tepidisphaeraceae bacterium]|jgi:hypothetical protein
MTRELRANLIFFVCLVLFVSPGFLILMSRKLNGRDRPNDLPDPVPSAIAYVQPPPVPPLPRIEPKPVRDWVRQLLQDRQGSDARMMRDADKAVVSDRFVTQLVSIAPAENGATRVALLIWDERSELATEQLRLTAEVGGRTIDAVVARTEPIDVTRRVRHALQDVGYVRPPEKVWWLSATLATTERPKSLTLHRRLTADTPEPEVIAVPAASATTQPTEPTP